MEEETISICGCRHVWNAKREEMGRKLFDNLARRLDYVPCTIRDGMDDMLTGVRPGLPKNLRRSLVCTNQIENLIGQIRRRRKKVRRWRDACLVKRRTVSAMIEAKMGMRRRRLCGCKSLPILQPPSSNMSRKFFIAYRCGGPKKPVKDTTRS